MDGMVNEGAGDFHSTRSELWREDCGVAEDIYEEGSWVSGIQGWYMSNMVAFTTPVLTAVTLRKLTL